jgi:hypothetical protein
MIRSKRFIPHNSTIKTQHLAFSPEPSTPKAQPNNAQFAQPNDPGDNQPKPPSALGLRTLIAPLSSGTRTDRRVVRARGLQ